MPIRRYTWRGHPSQAPYAIFHIGRSSHEVHDPEGFPEFVEVHDHEGFHEFVICLSGSFRHSINGETVRQNEHDVVLIREHDEHELNCAGAQVVNLPFTKQMITNAEELLQSPGLLQILVTDTVPRMTIPAERWPEYAEMIQELLVQPGKLRGRILFSQLFLQLVRDFVPEADDEPFGQDHPIWLRQLLQDLATQPRLNVTVADLSRMAGCSAEHLSRTFRRCLDTTPSQYLNDRRLRFAARLLERSSERVSDISFRVGIDDPAYFCRLFKKTYGESPSGYRERHMFYLPEAE